MNFIYSDKIYNTDSASEIVPILIDLFSPNSLLDVGCGIGTWIKVFQENDIGDYLGIDENLPLEQLLFDQSQFRIMDLKEEFNLNRKFDLAICLEVAEHLDKINADMLIASLTRHSDIIIFSAAVPHQGGQGHLNEQWIDYWEKKFSKYDFKFYDIVRPLIWNNLKVKWWYKQNMVVASSKNLKGMIKKMDNTLNYVHPELYKRNIVEKENILNGNLGVKSSIRILYKSIINKVIGAS